MAETVPIRAVVEKVIPEGRHGAYAVARNDEVGKITFSLSIPVWVEGDNPEAGEVVYLSDLREMQKGWRAHKAQRHISNQQ